MATSTGREYQKVNKILGISKSHEMYTTRKAYRKDILEKIKQVEEMKGERIEISREGLLSLLKLNVYYLELSMNLIPSVR